MPVQSFPTGEPPQRPFLLAQAVDLLKWEISTLSTQNWEDLPELKRKKVVLASQLHAAIGTDAADSTLADSDELKSQISDLEAQSHQKIESQIALIGHQILALQELHLYCRECLNISFRKFQEPIPSPQI